MKKPNWVAIVKIKYGCELSVYDVYILWNPSYPSALDRWIRDMAKKKR
jgi:hypothetical protein